jgi:hypothetical protein
LQVVFSDSKGLGIHEPRRHYGCDYPYENPEAILHKIEMQLWAKQCVGGLYGSFAGQVERAHEALGKKTTVKDFRVESVEGLFVPGSVKGPVWTNAGTKCGKPFGNVQRDCERLVNNTNGVVRCSSLFVDHENVFPGGVFCARSSLKRFRSISRRLICTKSVLS